jgi:hypothetical protein
VQLLRGAYQEALVEHEWLNQPQEELKQIA